MGGKVLEAVRSYQGGGVSAAGVCYVPMVVSFVYGWGNGRSKCMGLGERGRHAICRGVACSKSWPDIRCRK